MPNERVKSFIGSGAPRTFDDVGISSRYSEIVPTETDISSRFSRRIALRIPIVASPMDTVTESAMAIAAASAGGIGVIHRGLDPESQRKQVARVKFWLNGLIKTPFTLDPLQTLQEVHELREAKAKHFHTFPVVLADEVVHGLLTKSDVEFCDNDAALVKTAMTHRDELVTAPPGTSAEEAYALLRKSKKKVLLLVESDGTLAGMYLFSDLKRINNKSSTHNVDARGQLIVAAEVGTGEGALARAELLVAEHCDALVVGTAHGNSKNVVQTVEKLKYLYPGTEIVAGNVSEADGAKRLVDAGADGVLVGQGPGSICTTRIVTGIGKPQLTAVYECAAAIEGSGVPVIADGGIKYSGDVGKALIAGAACVMLGNLLAGTEESPGERKLIDGILYKDYRGMGSEGAMRDNTASRDRYGQGALTVGKFVPEGVEGLVPFKGSVKAVLDQISGGLRSTMAYVGARTISELQEVGELFELRPGGLRESHPHDIRIAKEAPNYRAP